MVICVQVTDVTHTQLEDLTVDHYKTKVLGGNPLDLYNSLSVL